MKILRPIKNGIFFIIDSIRCAYLFHKMKKPVVSIFGGKYHKSEDFYPKKAFEMASLIVQNDMSVLTGGGPGIMSAANKAASKRKDGLYSVGMLVQGMPEDMSGAAQKHIILRSYYVRKWAMIRKPKAFVFFPGGYGTLDEFFDVSMFKQIKYITNGPIVLIGKEYWNPLVSWLEEKVYKNDLVASHERINYFVTDDAGQAAEYIKKTLKNS